MMELCKQTYWEVQLCKDCITWEALQICQLGKGFVPRRFSPFPVTVHLYFVAKLVGGADKITLQILERTIPGLQMFEEF